MGTLFKNGTVISASDMVQADVLVEGEVVTLIGADAQRRQPRCHRLRRQVPDAGRH